jgi:hypothetical protein
MRKKWNPEDLRSSQCPAAAATAVSRREPSLPDSAAQGLQCTDLTPQELKNTRRRAISTLEVRPMGQKSGLKPDVAIRREWLRKVKEMWEKRKRRKQEKK